MMVFFVPLAMLFPEMNDCARVLAVSWFATEIRSRIASALAPNRSRHSSCNGSSVLSPTDIDDFILYVRPLTCCGGSVRDVCRRRKDRTKDMAEAGPRASRSLSRSSCKAKHCKTTRTATWRARALS
jgi:hypothetical protein